ncbi:MAG: DUF2922 domain-containing protein [Sporolactobacillus sp.]
MKRIDLVFVNAGGKSVTLSLNDPAEPVNPAAVKEAMTEIITRNVFTSAGGQLTAIKSARLSESVTMPITLD